LKLKREKVNFTLAQTATVRYSSVPRNDAYATKRDEESENADFEGVDELHDVPHNLASLLLTNITLRRNQQDL
jgi:hypothetical protein